MSFVDFFPTELTEVVFSHLSVPDLVNSSLVCVSWYEASNRSSVWKAAIKRSIPKDRFRIVSNLDRFTGVASNYDDNHCFQVDRQSPSNLSPMNPWKISLCQDNFVRKNWYGSDTNGLARHQIKFEDDIVLNVKVVYPSTFPQDHLYLPIIVEKIDQPVMDFLLIRLDGTPRILKKILSTESKIPIICIDRDCMVWVQNGQIKYLSLLENIDGSQTENLGRLISESFLEDWEFVSDMFYMITMNDKYIVAGFQKSFVKVWCKKTKQLKLTHEAKQTISNVNCVITACFLRNEHIYFKHEFRYSEYSIHDERCFMEVYDIEDKFVENQFSSSNFNSIAFSDKYYAMYSELGDHSEIHVRDIDTNEVKISLNVNIPNHCCFPRRVWIVDNEVLYFEKGRLKILNLVDGNISTVISVPKIQDEFWILGINNSFLLAKYKYKVEIWDWKLDRKLHDLLVERVTHFYNDETKLVALTGNKCVNVIGFW